jgi:two-component system, sensor histidine kinase PdtaS
MSMAPSGVPAVGPLPWGTHFCHFCGSKHDLAECLVPYFKAGLENNDSCLWVTSEPFRADEARNALRAAVPDLDEREKGGQIQIVDHEEWYLRQGQLSAREVAESWTRRAREAVDAGYSGLRLTGNTFWLETHDWGDFTDYEATVNEAFLRQPIIALCSYFLERCRPTDVLDVVRNHQFAVARRGGQWAVIEDASLKLARTELERLNTELERHVAKRTAELERALADKDTLFQEVHHRVRNNIQVISSMLKLALREDRTDPREVLLDISGRVQAIGLVHDALYNGGEPSRVDFGEYLRRLGQSLLLLRDDAERIAIEVEADDSAIGMATAATLGMIACELVTNALKHAFPGNATGRIRVEARSADGEIVLTVADNGPGTRKVESGESGFGLTLVRQLVRQLGGKIEAVHDDGTRVTVRVAAWRPATASIS